MQDKIFKVLLILSAVLIPIIGGGIILSLTVDASGAFEEFGFWKFVFSDDWVTTAGKESYGALPFITGTLLTTALALIMCIPFSLPVALFTGEYFKGRKIAAILGTVIAKHEDSVTVGFNNKLGEKIRKEAFSSLLLAKMNIHGRIRIHRMTHQLHIDLQNAIDNLMRYYTEMNWI